MSAKALLQVIYSQIRRYRSGRFMGKSVFADEILLLEEQIEAVLDAEEGEGLNQTHQPKGDRMIKTIEQTMEKIEGTISELLDLRMDLVMLKYHISEQTQKETEG